MLVPNLYGAFELGGGFFGGIAITAPFGNANEYDKAWYGRYLGTKTAALSADINPNIAGTGSTTPGQDRARRVGPVSEAGRHQRHRPGGDIRSGRT